MSAFIVTRTGRRFYFDRPPEPEWIDPADIAHALSNLCRFTGHTSDFYSVAQHSVLVSCYLPEDLALAGLLHDATEAYLTDISTPLKQVMDMEAYRERERQLMRVVEVRFGLPAGALEHPKVKEVDSRMLATEAYHLMPRVANFGDGERYNLASLRPLYPRDARLAFAKTFASLTA